jgi:hypothetical protein
MGENWSVKVNGLEFSAWEIIYLLTRVEDDLKKWRINREKERFLQELKNKLQSVSVGNKPFNLEVRV